jgi:hypothetical protein
LEFQFVSTNFKLSSEVAEDCTCDACGKVLKSQASLRIHKTFAHELKKPDELFFCEICGFVLSYKHLIKKHEGSGKCLKHQAKQKTAAEGEHSYATVGGESKVSEVDRSGEGQEFHAFQVSPL